MASKGRAAPRPVRIQLVSTEAKHKAFAAKQRLRANKVFIDADLTPHQLQVRKSLMEARKRLAGQGKKPHWRAEDLWFWENGARHKYVHTDHAPSNQAAPTYAEAVGRA
jgi:hypothetical protein